MAARRMKGVVRPQQAPTRRKPRIQRKTEGWGDKGGVSGSIVKKLETKRLWETAEEDMW